MPQSTLVVGVSGSGKTTWAEHFCSNYSSVYVVNGEIDLPQCVHVGFGEIMDRLEPKSAIIFDDVVKPNAKQILVIKSVLLYEKRHNDIDVVILQHSVSKNNTWELLLHMDQFVITHSPANESSFEELIRAIKIDKVKARRIWLDFVSRPEKFLYLKYDTGTGNFQVVTINQTESEKERESKRRWIASILAAKDCNWQLALELFDFIVANTNVRTINERDLSIVVGQHRASVVDMLYFITCRSPAVPNARSVLLYMELSKKFAIPVLFLENPIFKRIVTRRQKAGRRRRNVGVA